MSAVDDLLALVKRALAEVLAERGAERPPRRFLTVKTVSDELGVSERTVRRWVRTGALRTMPLGRQHRIERAELERFQRERSGGALAADIEEQAHRLLRLVPRGKE